MTINKKNKLYLAMMVFLIPLIYSATASATNYYADPVNGSDANPGTLASPWKHVCFATGGGGIIWTGTNNSATSSCPTNNPRKLAAGDTLYLRGSGVFQENYIQFTNSGTAGSPITITTYTGDAQAVIDAGMTNAGSISGGHEAIALEDRGYIVIDNLEIRRGYQMNISISRNNSGGNHLTIKNSNLHDIVAYDNSGQVYIASADSITIQDSHLHGVQSSPSNHSGACIHAFINSNLTVKNNELDNCVLGIYMKQGVDTTSTATIQNNYIHDNSDYGMLISAPNSVVSHNIFENNNQGILVFEDSASCNVLQSDHNTFSHNTIVGNKGYGINLDTGSCTGAIFTIVKDNIISGSTDANFRELSIWHYATSDGSNTTLEYNLINGSNFSSPISIAGQYYSVTSLVSNLLSTLLGRVSTSIQQTPTFVNASAHNYQLCAAGVSGCTTSSPGRGAASDGTDMGARICQVGVNKASCPTAPAPPSNLRVN